MDVKRIILAWFSREQQQRLINGSAFANRIKCKGFIWLTPEGKEVLATGVCAKGDNSNIPQDARNLGQVVKLIRRVDCND